jgi:hypothetical protein
MAGFGSSPTASTTVSAGKDRARTSPFAGKDFPLCARQLGRHRIGLDRAHARLGNQLDPPLSQIVEDAPASGMGHLEPELGFLLEDRHPTPPLGEELGELEPDEPTAHDHDLAAERHPGFRGLTQHRGRGGEPDRATGTDGEATEDRELFRRARLALAGEKASQILAVEDVVAIDTRNRRPLAAGAGRDEHQIRGDLANQLGRHFGSESHVDADPLYLSSQPVE